MPPIAVHVRPVQPHTASPAPSRPQSVPRVQPIISLHQPRDVFDRRAPGDAAVHRAFEQRVAAEAVAAMHATSDLPRAKKARQRHAALRQHARAAVNRDTAHGVVHNGRNGSHVEAAVGADGMREDGLAVRVGFAAGRRVVIHAQLLPQRRHVDVDMRSQCGYVLRMRCHALSMGAGACGVWTSAAHRHSDSATVIAAAAAAAAKARDGARGRPACPDTPQRAQTIPDTGTGSVHTFVSHSRIQHKLR
eukprot:364794-Chlamydomonas_euryale.AAC.7